jgi:hypothetical protein
VLIRLATLSFGITFPVYIQRTYTYFNPAAFDDYVSTVKMELMIVDERHGVWMGMSGQG